MKDIYDVCILGAGPAGLSVLSALHNPEHIGAINDHSYDRFCHHKKKNKQKKQKKNKKLNICVIDPASKGKLSFDCCDVFF